MRLFVDRMPKVLRITISMCKLVTSAGNVLFHFILFLLLKTSYFLGLARFIFDMKSPLKYLDYSVWNDRYSNPVNLEKDTTGYHLCEAIRKHADTLTHLHLRPYRFCEEALDGLIFPRLRLINLEYDVFCHCTKTHSPRKWYEFSDSLQDSLLDKERFPSLPCNQG